MPEVKNAFIKSKMNKDLDARLMPSGEYRDAMNIAISKSEGSDVGAVENIKGNTELVDIKIIESVTGLDIIGYYADEANNCIYIFSTNQNETASPPENVGDAAECFIHKYDFSGQGALIKLVEGSFLNFDKNSFITGVHLLENLLFFTDDRNQPRVINVSIAESEGVTHYTAEEHISVAKYAPYKVISLLNKFQTRVGATVTNSPTFQLKFPSLDGVKIGDVIVSNNIEIGRVKSYSNPTVSVDRNVSLSIDDEVIFKRSSMINRTEEYLNSYNKGTGDVDNPNYDINWKGDSDFLEDKFIRFSYRFKYEDNQYSILAPFTQPVFIPKQFGYFVGDDETQTYKTSVLNFFENFVQEVGLKIPLPAPDIESDLKIKEIDVIYKESDALAVKVMASITAQTANSNKITGEDGYYYNFNYTSKKPYKTLPEKEIVRVYDKVPVKAQSQEVVSNRVVYGNYIDKNSPPALLPNYNITSGSKLAKDNSAAEYPSHTLKQNRTYQVGIVLSDKYGRSTSVLLSSRDDGTDGAGSTIFHGFKSAALNVEEWHGDVMSFNLNEPISESPNSSIGYPGFYADSNSGNKSWDISGATFYKTANTYVINQNLTGVVFAGDYLRGKYIDYTKVTDVTYSAPNTTITTEEQVADTYIEDSGDPVDKRFAYTINKLGWYSYKIVVKQTEQDYYNVYLPLVINGEYGAANTGGDIDSLAQAVLINDNINKVPRDLSEVGPDQKQYGSSVRLFGRVAPQRGNTDTNNEQWYPNISSDQVTKIATAEDSGYDTTNAITGMYKSDSNPLIATISSLAPSASTETFGRLPDIASGAAQNLSIYETNPTISLLDIFWESSTSGLLSDLNQQARNVFNGVTGVDNSTYDFEFEEDEVASPSSPFTVAGPFRFVNNNGPIPSEGAGNNNPVVTVDNLVVRDANGFAMQGWQIVRDGSTTPGQLTNQFNLQTTGSKVFLEDPNYRTYTFTYTVTYEDNVTDPIQSEVTSTGGLGNVQPVLISGTSISHQFTQNQTSLFTLADYIKNGSALVGSQNLQLNYSKLTEVNGYGSPSSYITVDTNTGSVSKPASSVPGPLTITVNATDANGTGDTSDTQTHILNFGPTPWNLTVGSHTLNCITSDSYSVVYFAPSIPSASGFPSGFPTTDCGSIPASNCYTSLLGSGTSELTQGRAGFKFSLTVANPPCPSGGSNTVYMRCWVYYRADSSSSWSIATPVSGFQNAIYNTQIAIGLSNSGTNSIYRQYNTAGQYRLMAHYNNPYCGSCGAYVTPKIEWFDANYP
jgi:hypothetical protein